MEKVTLGRNVFVVLVAVLVVSLLALAFLLGRMSGGGGGAQVAREQAPLQGAGAAQPGLSESAAAGDASRPAPKAPMTGEAPAGRGGGGAAEAPQAASAIPGDAAPPGKAPAVPASPGAPGSTAVQGVPVAPPSAGRTPATLQPASSGALVSGRPADEHDRRAVADYFAVLDTVQEGKLADNPQSFAQELLQSAMGGDVSGLDRIIRQLEEGRAKTLAVAPPASCREFHRGSLALADESLQVMRSMRTALASKDLSALAAIGQRAQSLKARAEDLDRRERAIKRQYGLLR